MTDSKPWSFTENAPPAALSPPQQALWWLKKGNWPWGRNGRKPMTSARRGKANTPMTSCMRWCTGSRGTIQRGLLVPAGGRQARRRYRKRMAADRCRTFTLIQSTGQVTQTMTNTFANYPSLAGKTIFVTGGASGIGAEIVRAFSAQGAKVGFIDLDRPASAALAEGIGVRDRL